MRFWKAARTTESSIILPSIANPEEVKSLSDTVGIPWSLEEAKSYKKTCTEKYPGSICKLKFEDGTLKVSIIDYKNVLNVLGAYINARLDHKLGAAKKVKTYSYSKA